MCKVCQEQEVEHENNFIFMCSSYDTEIIDLYREINNRIPGFSSLEHTEQIQIVMKIENVVLLSKYLCSIVEKRQVILFK